MGIPVSLINYDLQSAGQGTLDKLPDECPFCHKGIQPRLSQANPYINDSRVEVALCCSRRDCQRTFVGYYQRQAQSNNFALTGVSQGNVKNAAFSDAIVKTSSSFVTIYQQANTAEQQGLLEICGVGYRKALEFLIKDYAVSKKPADKASILKTALSAVISNFIDDRRIQAVSSRATWLGNDETHYVRLWEGKDLDDLKSLIRLTVHWIEMEIETERFQIEMPDRKAPSSSAQ